MSGAASGDASNAASSPLGTDTVEMYAAAVLEHVADSVTRVGKTAHTVGAHRSFQYVQAQRVANGVPEVHDRWNDVALVQAGRGSISLGGRVSGSHVEAPGEHRGGTISGGTTRSIAPGDLLIIPAGVPHQYLIRSGDTLRYLTVKTTH